jgi:hydroxymethylpyrimidine/phosphomethylpyrimidine kinase|tara:strand:+ start:14880 stop:15596 length:717 start_codon:yes stop_codon:yes gene_type:complete
MPKVRPYCLTIAGFDPSGGAGVLADCKSFEQSKTQGLAVITANTMQTEDSFKHVDWIANEIILEQLNLLLDRYKIQFIKIGLISSGDLLEKIIHILNEKCNKPTIVWDPILSASAGGEFNLIRFNEFLKSDVCKNIIITPNIPEYESLELKNNSATIYLKGGHSENKGKDVLYFEGKEFPFAPHVKTDFSKHGTGCIFASALLANLALDYPMIKACLRAKRYVEKRIVSNGSLLAYHK